jgi:5-methylcytosine-specific restriction endonuclease McrA
MMLTGPQHAIFMNRTEQIYQAQRRRALSAGQVLDYGPLDLRHYVFNNLGNHHCHYCRGPVAVESFCVDNRIPPDRGGSYAFHNLAIVCKDCQRAKGPLDHFEYRELISLLSTWAPPVRRNFIARLKAGCGIPLQHHLFPKL